jgi:hypothetical protein
LPVAELRTYVPNVGLRWVEQRHGRRWIGLNVEHRKIAQIAPVLAGGGRRWQARMLDGSLFGVDVGRFDSPEAAMAAVDLRLAREPPRRPLPRPADQQRRQGRSARPRGPAELPAGLRACHRASRVRLFR